MHEQTAKSAVVYDRYPLFLRAVASVLEGIGIEVVGMAGDPEAALRLVERHSPDVFVAGLATPAGSMDGLELLDRAIELRAGLKVIGLADEADDHDVAEVFAAGASAYLSRAARPRDVEFAIRQTYEPSIHLAMDRVEWRKSDRVAAEASLLTEREQEILALVAVGHSNGELARMLHVAPQTVKFHLSNIYRKLNVANRTQASRQAQLLNLLPRRTARAAAPVR